MKSDHTTEVYELMDRAWQMEGAARVMALEQAVRLADSHHDVELGFSVRQSLIEAATFSGYPQPALVAFAWCLAQSDRDPERLGHANLLWQYKWIADSLYSFPEIPWQQVEETFKDLARRSEQAGSGARAVYKLYMKAAMHRGDRRAARRHHDKWAKSPRDTLTDCRACDIDAEVQYLAFLGKDADALTAAAPVLCGSHRCAEIPHITYARVLLPLVRLGRTGDAARYHLKGYRLVARNREFIREVASHIQFLALTDNLAEAVKIFEKHLVWAVETTDLDERFDYYLAGRFLLSRLTRAGRGDHRLRLPAALSDCPETRSLTADELARWISAELKSLAARFDARNGTDFCARSITASDKLHRLAQPFPLTSDRTASGKPKTRARLKASERGT